MVGILDFQSLQDSHHKIKPLIRKQHQLAMVTLIEARGPTTWVDKLVEIYCYIRAYIKDIQ